MLPKAIHCLIRMDYRNILLIGVFLGLVNLDQETDRVECIIDLYLIPLNSPDLA